MEPTMLIAIGKALLPLLAPIIVSLLKKYGPAMIDKMNPIYKAVLSAGIAIAISVLTGMVTDPATAVTAVLAALGAGKVRDIQTGKELV